MGLSGSEDEDRAGRRRSSLVPAPDQSPAGSDDPDLEFAMKMKRRGEPTQAGPDQIRPAEDGNPLKRDRVDLQKLLPVWL